MTSIAHYSLLAMRPDPERIDTLCVGALVITTDGDWSVITPGIDKLNSLGFVDAANRLVAMSINLQELLGDCETLQQARLMLAQMRSTLVLHDFEGIFAFSSSHDFNAHIHAISTESVVLPKTPLVQIPLPRAAKTQVRAKLRRHFAEMGILAQTGDFNADHKIVPNYPLSEKHGLKAEFALKNSVWHITETVDFDVATEGVRHKTFEAQAKCLVLRAAQEILGPKTKRYIVVNGGDADHATNSIDLLSTVGDLFMTESSEDMTAYLDTMARAAGGTRQLNG